MISHTSQGSQKKKKALLLGWKIPGHEAQINLPHPSGYLSCCTLGLRAALVAFIRKKLFNYFICRMESYPRTFTQSV